MTSSASPTAVAPGRWAPLLAVCLGTFMLLLDVSIVNVALPDMATALDASFRGRGRGLWAISGDSAGSRH